MVVLVVILCFIVVLPFTLATIGIQMVKEVGKNVDARQKKRKEEERFRSMLRSEMKHAAKWGGR